jgi:hypothetical protein
VPILLVSGCVKAYDRATHGDCFLPKGACSPVEMLDKAKIMLARKRGPKKSSFVPEPNSAVADARESSGHGMPAFAS